jgi:hypothetical protein
MLVLIRPTKKATEAEICSNMITADLENKDEQLTTAVNL